jgi:GntR family histidine utilization transcriptional repressor
MSGTLSIKAAVSGNSPQPLYLQVKQVIADKVQSGLWPPETRIPSENALVEALGVSRMTINRALRELAAEGALVRLQGVGTYVARPRPQFALLEIRSIAYEIESRGGKHSSQVHLLQEEPATPETALALMLPAGAAVYHALLVHFDGDRPVQVADRYVNPAIAPEFLLQDFTAVTPNEYLMKVAPVTEVEHIIEAVLPHPRIYRLLALSKAVPCLLLHRKTWVGRTVATASRFTYPGSGFRLGGRFKPISEAHRVLT